MNERQKEILEQKFEVSGLPIDYAISRMVYESFPCPLMAWKWSDEQMKELAHNISNNIIESFAEYDLSDAEEAEDFEELWLEVVEFSAVKMGMKYYEDLSKDDYEVQRAEWENIK